MKKMVTVQGEVREIDSKFFNAEGKIIPDQQSIESAEREHPEKSLAEGYRLAQADTLLRHSTRVGAA